MLQAPHYAARKCRGNVQLEKSHRELQDVFKEMYSKRGIQREVFKERYSKRGIQREVFKERY